MRDNATMKAITWRKAAPVTTAMLLSACSAVPLTGNATSPASPANYGALVGNALRSFNGYVAYSNFEISAPRWVHAATGWNWLTCVRYYDRGQRRTYVFFIDDGAVISARYDVLTDQCGAQQYLPFDAATGTITAAAPAPVAQEPLSPMAILQQPIY
jgi:hypothetical protein